MTLLTSGASPISDEVFTFLKICFGSVIEGYGKGWELSSSQSVLPSVSGVG